MLKQKQTNSWSRNRTLKSVLKEITVLTVHNSSELWAAVVNDTRKEISSERSWNVKRITDCTVDKLLNCNYSCWCWCVVCDTVCTFLNHVGVRRSNGFRLVWLAGSWRRSLWQRVTSAAAANAAHAESAARAPGDMRRIGVSNQVG